ncbi:uncharacterized protein [Macrobrachium rosenbergii]|uniref:uncharacterized protein n=1 Tax=Macrobrachium rosenbergii TaxID=79674 RepID=UPI0034D5DF99
MKKAERTARHQLLLGILMLALAPGLTSARKSVHQASSFCSLLSDETLSCDFEQIEEHVQFDKLDSEVGRKIKTVYLKNIEQLSVSGTPCVNLHLDGITEATFILAHTCQSVGDISMTVTNSKVNIVPKYVTHLHMEGSTADWLTGDKGFKSLSIVNSRIKTLNIDKAIGEPITVKFEGVTIDVFEELKLENKAQLLLVNATINKFKSNSLQLADAQGTISNSYIKFAEEKAIKLEEKGLLTLKENVGTITFSGPAGLPLKKEEPRAPGVPPPNIKPRPPRNSSSPLIWIIPTVLAVVEAMIIMVNCTNWFPALKSRRHRRSSSSQGLSGSEYGMMPDSVYYATGDYSSINKRRTGMES